MNDSWAEQIRLWRSFKIFPLKFNPNNSPPTTYITGWAIHLANAHKLSETFLSFLDCSEELISKTVHLKVCEVGGGGDLRDDP
jgi:hypothetical protein